jgi:death-on-curing protein
VVACGIGGDALMKLSDVTFIEAGDVKAAHATSLGAFGGAAGLRSRELLLSAVMAPRATWDGAPLYPSLAEMAGAYLFGLARNHPFVDGNKRTAFVTALTFLEVNGVPLTLGEEWIGVVEGVAAGTVSRDELVAKLVDAMPNRDPVAVEP